MKLFYLNNNSQNPGHHYTCLEKIRPNNSFHSTLWHEENRYRLLWLRKKTIKIDPNFLFRNSFYQYENYKYKLNNIYDLRLEWKTNKRIFGIAQNDTKFFLIVFCSSLFRYNTQFNDWLTTNILFWWKYMLNHKMFCWG